VTTWSKLDCYVMSVFISEGTWTIIQAHGRRGILLHPQSRLAFTGRRSCRALLHACCWLALLLLCAPVCCCTLPPVSLSHSQLTHPLFTLLPIIPLTCFTCSITYPLTTTAYSPSHYLHPAFLCHQRTLTGTATPSNPQLPNTSSCPYRSLSPDSPALHIARPIAFHHRPSRLHKTRAARDTVKPNSTTSRS
jgi:hypothetical protein